MKQFEVSCNFFIVKLKLLSNQYLLMAAKEARAEIDASDIQEERSLAFQLKRNKLCTRKGACACKARRRKGRESAKTRKACGTSKNDQNEGGEERGGLKRISAAIATVADFQTMQRANRAIAFREEDSSRRIKISRQEKEEEKTR